MLHDGLFWPQTDKSSQVKFYSACHFYFQIFILTHRHRRNVTSHHFTSFLFTSFAISREKKKNGGANLKTQAKQ